MQHDKNFCSDIVTQAKQRRQVFHPNQINLRKPCECGNLIAKIGAGRRAKEVSLACSECKQFIGWCPSNQLKKLAALGGEG